MPKRPQRRSNGGPLKGATLAERIDEASERAGVTTTEIAKAAGVTWAAAKRWRTGEAQPRSEHLRAIAGVCSVTLEELLGVFDGREPPYPAWAEFLETPTGRALTDAQRHSLATHSFPPGTQPTVGTYLLMAEALRTLERRV